MIRKDIPFLFDNIYKAKINSHFILYNPYSYKGLLIVNNKYWEIFSSINGQRTIDDYLKLISGKEAIAKNTIFSFFRELEKADIINFRNCKNFFHHSPKQKFTIDKSLTLWINLTNQCNFRCTYCFVEKRTKKMSKETINFMVEKIFHEALKHKIEFIGFNIAGGEPLLEVDLLKTLVLKINSFRKKSSYKHIVVSTSVITNASLLTEKLADFFQKNGVLVSISIDGIGKYNDASRKFADGSGTYEYVINGFKIAQKYKILSNTICTITPKNISHLPTLVKFFQTQNIKFTLHFYKKVSNSCKEQIIRYNRDLIDSYKKALKSIYRNYFHKNSNFSPFYQVGNKLLDTVILFKNVSKYSCTAGLSFFSINPDGSVTACPSDDKKIIAHISDNNLLDNLRRQRLMAEKNLSVENKERCRSCLWKYNCRGMCALEKKYDWSEDKCLIMKELIPYVIKLEAERILKASLKQFIEKRERNN